MLFTRGGDEGDSKVLNRDERISKDSALFEALGTVDELNSLLGLCKMKSEGLSNVDEILEAMQEDLFILQAELAGADKKIEKEKVDRLERIIFNIEDKLPEIHSFFIPGGSELSALIDVARAVSRRAERRIIKALKEKDVHVGKQAKIYINRLSSVLYALVRFVNFKNRREEIPPHYE